MEYSLRPTAEAQEAVEHFDVPDRRGRAVRNRCRVASAGSLPRQDYATSKGREASGGTWDLFPLSGVRRNSDITRWATAFRPEGGQGDRRRAVDPEVHPRGSSSDHRIDGKIRYRHRVVAASWSTSDARWTVEGSSAARRASRRASPVFPVDVQRLLRNRVGYLPEFPGTELFKGQDRPSAEMDRRHDYRARSRGDRQRCDGGSRWAGDGGQRRGARHHAAALADLHGGGPVAGSVCDEDAQAPAAEARVCRHALENVLFGMYIYQLCRRQPEKVKNALLAMCARCWGRTYDVGMHFTTALQSVGPAALPRARRRVSFRAIRAARSRSSPTTSTRLRKPDQAEVRRELEANPRDRDGALGALRRRGDAHGRRRAGRSSKRFIYQGHDVFRRARTRVGVRLHQCLVDA